ncbi:MAG: hypothetical protein ABIJ52_18080 [Pseudomonadota bacterium]
MFDAVQGWNYYKERWKINIEFRVIFQDNNCGSPPKELVIQDSRVPGAQGSSDRKSERILSSLLWGASIRYANIIIMGSGLPQQGKPVRASEKYRGY